MRVDSEWVQVALLTFDLIGTFVFALSGGVLAVRKQLDLFGVLVLACAAAVSWGVITQVRSANRSARAVSGPTNCEPAIGCEPT